MVAHMVMVVEWATNARSKTAAVNLDSLNSVRSQHKPEEVIPEWIRNRKQAAKLKDAAS
jgi:hypothetical protein